MKQPVSRVGVGGGTGGNQRVTKMKDVQLPALASCDQAEQRLRSGMGQGQLYLVSLSQERQKAAEIQIRRILLCFCFEYNFWDDMFFH